MHFVKLPLLDVSVSDALKALPSQYKEQLKKGKITLIFFKTLEKFLLKWTMHEREQVILSTFQQ